MHGRDKVTAQVTVEANIDESARLAQAAEQRGRWAEALQHWERFKEESSASPAGYVGICTALWKLGRAEEAEALLTPALRIFPGSLDLLALYARVGTLIAGKDERTRRWRNVLLHSPDDGEIWAAAARDAQTRGDAAGAEQILHDAMIRLPNDIALACEHARLPENAGNFVEAVQRWALLAERRPDALEPQVGLAKAFWSGALALEKKFRSRAVPEPTSEAAILARAQIFQRAGRLQAAEAAWHEGTQWFPGSRTMQRGYVSALRANGKFEKATVALGRFLKEAPGDFRLLRLQAMVFAQQRDWKNALPAFNHLAERFGSGRSGKQLRYEAGRVVMLARVDQAATAEQSDSRFEIPESLVKFCEEVPETGDALRILMARFESLGNGCEFGIVQRRYGAEPMGLLRWSVVPSAGLIEGLAQDWAGVGDPAQTELVTQEISGEQYTLDQRYKLRVHTFTLVTQVNRDKFYKQQCKRLVFLKERFLEDARNAEKIYLYKGNIEQDEILAIHEGLRRFNPANRLLCVMEEDEANKAGRLVELAEGVFVGRIKRFSQADTDYPSWLKLCQQMHTIAEVLVRD